MTDAAQVYLELLLQTQFLPPEKLMAYQASLVEPLVRHAREHVPFYRDSGRLNPLFTTDDRIDWSRWEEIPVLTRVEAQKHIEALYSEVIPENCGLRHQSKGIEGSSIAHQLRCGIIPEAPL